MCEIYDAIVKKGIVIGKEQGLALGEKRGKNLGMDLFANLTSALLNDNRIDDLKKAIKNKSFCNKLIKEYKL